MSDARECARLLLETIPNLMRSLHLISRQCRSDDEKQLNMGQFRMLAMLNEAPRTLGDLAASHHVTPSTMSRTIDVLVRKGWVLRVADLADRRQVDCHARATRRRDSGAWPGPAWPGRGGRRRPPSASGP